MNIVVTMMTITCAQLAGGRLPLEHLLFLVLLQGFAPGHRHRHRHRHRYWHQNHHQHYDHTDFDISSWACFLLHLGLNLRERKDSLTLSYGGISRTLWPRAPRREPLHQRLGAEVPLDLPAFLWRPTMLGRAGGELAFLVLSRIGLCPWIDQAPESKKIMKSKPKTRFLWRSS